ncbi:hypothetical protein [Clostridium sp. DJ247]|uniref:hypothetical protein n=1 Tax=Clostridium sp. DJ247 TaxID=2726188 RepID=UPI001629D18E|nr:hypothetical protein [Clostridium sp. DJ247]MBC2579963.1 hypothetical protein [Clostridium sp. DJ247]
MKKYELKLNLNFLDINEYSKGEKIDIEEVVKYQGEAYESFEKFCKENSITIIDGCLFEGDTSLDSGYDEWFNTTIETTLSEEELKEKLEQLRRTISYCNYIRIEED